MLLIFKENENGLQEEVWSWKFQGSGRTWDLALGEGKQFFPFSFFFLREARGDVVVRNPSAHVNIMKKEDLHNFYFSNHIKAVNMNLSNVYEFCVLSNF